MFRSLFGKKRRKAAPGSASAVDTIKDARVGDVFTITGLSPDYDDAYFIIEKRNRYESANAKWYELLGVDGETRLWLHWSDGGGLSVTATPDVRPSGLSQLGLDESDLIRMDEERSIDASLTLEGTRFYYRNSGEAFYFQDDVGEGDGYYLWEFESEDSSKVVSVDKWAGTPFQAYVSDVVPADDITVYRR